MILIGRGLDLEKLLEKRESAGSIAEDLDLCGFEDAGSRSESEGEEKEKRIQFPVTIAGGYHLFPYRTQKLRLQTLKVLGWKRPGRLGRRRISPRVIHLNDSLFHVEE